MIHIGERFKNLTLSNEGVVKPLLLSNSFHANWITLVVIPIVWPFLSESFRTSSYAPACITGWSLLINAIFRVLLRKRAITILEAWDAIQDSIITETGGTDTKVAIVEAKTTSTSAKAQNAKAALEQAFRDT